LQLGRLCCGICEGFDLSRSQFGFDEILEITVEL
jgi:hypothetical protein